VKNHLLRDRQSRNFLFAILFIALLVACSKRPSLVDRFEDNGSSSDIAILKEELSRPSQADPSSEAEYEFLRGELYLAQEKFDEALFSYQKVRESSSTVTKRIAQLYIRQGKLAEAIDQIESLRKNQDLDFELLELLGGAYAAAQKLNKAEEIYRELLSKSEGKQRSDATIYLVTILAQTERVSEAKDLLNALIKKSPKSGIAHYYLARMHELSGDAIAAERSYRNAIRVSPDNDGLSLELARVLAAQKKLDEATEIVKQVVARSPQNQQARQILGQLLLTGDNSDGALKQLESLSGIEKNSADTRIKIALIKLERRDFVGAENELNFVLAENPKHSIARYYLALAAAGQGKADEVATVVSHLKPGEKYYIESRMLSAFVYRQNNRPADAITILTKTDEILNRKTDLRILSFLVSLHKESGKISDAVDVQKRVVEAEPNRDTNYFLLAALLQDNGQFEESIAAGKKAIELNPKNADALNFVGYSLAERGKNLAEARELIAKAIELEPQNGFFVDSLGWVFFQEGRFEDAELHLKRAAELVPTDAVILEHYAAVQEKLGRVDGALSTAKKALVEAPNSDDKEVQIRLQELIARLERSAQ